MRICSGCQQETDSNLKCPVCPSGVEYSYFCSQPCFKANYSSHRQERHQNQPPKSSDRSQDARLGLFHDFDKEFTGPLRPWPTTPSPTVPEHIPRPDYAETRYSRLEENSRGRPIKVHNESEIKDMRESCRIARGALEAGKKLCTVGSTPVAVDDAVHAYIIEHNAYPSPLMYYGFPKSCCVSLNEVVCHGVPDLRPFENGDIVNIDVTVFFKGQHADLNETVPIGEISDEDSRLIETAKGSMLAAIAICKPGTPYRNIGGVIEDFCKQNGFTVTRNYTGHGIGSLFHTNPTIYHFKNNKAKGLMQAGHVFTIEPMVNVGEASNIIWPDDWTVCTSDGKRSAQFEHQILITPDGAEILTGPELPQD